MPGEMQRRSALKLLSQQDERLYGRIDRSVAARIVGPERLPKLWQNYPARHEGRSHRSKMPIETRTSEQGLFPELAASIRGVKAGVLPSQDIQDLISTGKITARTPILEEQIQPASVDLRVGDMAHRVQASFLPGQHATVEQRINELRMSRIDLTSSTVLEKGCVYIVPLLEEVHLPDNMSGKATPKARPVGLMCSPG